MAMLPMAMYGLEIPAGDVAIPARGDIPAAFRVTMAAIDPSAEPEGEDDANPRATLKVIRQPLGMEDDDSEDGFDIEDYDDEFGEDDSEDDEDDEDSTGGPSDPAKSKKAKREAARNEIKRLLEEEGMDLDDDDDDELPNGVNGITKSAKAKGKMPASDEDSSDEDSDSEEEGEIEEFVICTLDPLKNYQQPLDMTIGDGERVWFKVSGTHSIFLTGNYVEPTGGDNSGMYDPDSDEEEDYDLPPDMDELDDEDDDESIDELDDMEDPRVTELDDEEEAPALVQSKAKKIEDKKPAANKNKRPAPDSDDEDAGAGAEGLDEMIAKVEKTEQPAVNGEQKLTKKQLKKLKKNDGAAAPAAVTEKTEVKAEPPSSNKSDKKVSFAKELEQGPTPTKDSKASEKPAEGDKSKPSLGVKTIQGVSVDDKKLGSGQAAKNGDRVSMRYIGKLKADNKVFDSNKSGKPFSFKLGSGEVIKGWDIGVKGMQAGAERRITVPAHLAYGSKRTGDIPPNSALVFDVKVLDINKGK